ncbi:MAG: DUF6465 family protein [Eubacterium sp.]
MATKKTASEDTSKVTTTTAETAAEKKPEAKKTTTKKAATKKTTAAKTTVKEKPETEKKETKRKVKKPAKTIVLQYLGKEIDEAEITERAIAQFSALEGGVAVKKITLYLKPEEEAAYYVINDQYTGKVGF